MKEKNYERRYIVIDDTTFTNMWDSHHSTYTSALESARKAAIEYPDRKFIVCRCVIEVKTYQPQFQETVFE